LLPASSQHADLPGSLAALFLAGDGDRARGVERLLLLLRSASSPTAAQIVREALGGDVLMPLAERLGGHRPELRASVSIAVWMGMTIMRTVIAVAPLERRDAEIEQRLRLLFEPALSEQSGD